MESVKNVEDHVEHIIEIHGDRIRIIGLSRAEARGITVVFVDARYSSQGCSRCGHIERSNRQSQSWFHCKACGYQTNADRNAALNLAQRGTTALSGPFSQPAYRDDCSQLVASSSYCRKAFNILEWMYDNSDFLRLERKYKTYLEALSRTGFFADVM